ncbi:hypothetical protein [Streptomyces sp. N35]|uniref:hypothetical protein n=1 Tax=Streptomyces sp. N35 TaxID=2795730 RepID=UPI0018F696D5|nr:hypothetical protein [Streptomyces sp. N35]
MSMFFCGVYVTALLALLVGGCLWTLREPGRWRRKVKYLYVAPQGVDLLRPVVDTAPVVPAQRVWLPRQACGLAR